MNILEFHFNPKEHLSQVFSFGATQAKGQDWGVLHVIAELQNPLPTSKKFLSELAKLIQKEFVASAESSKRKKPAPDASLKVALRHANSFLAREIKNGNVHWVGNLHIAVLVLAPGSAYFTKSGGMRLWILRGGSFTDIGRKLEESPADPPKIFGAISSGKIADGDRLLVLPKDLLTQLKKEGLWNEVATIEDDKELRKAFKGKENVLSGLLFSAFLEPAWQPRSLAHRPLPALPHLALPSALSFPSFPALRRKALKRPELRFSIPKSALIAVSFLFLLGAGFLLFQQGNKELQEARGAEVRVEVLMQQADIALEKKRNTEAGLLLEEAWNIAAGNAISGNPLEARFQQLQGDLEAKLADVFAVHSLAAPPLFFDLSEVPDFEGARLFLAGTQLIAYNPAYAEFVSLDLETRDTKRVSAPHNLTLGASAADRPFFFGEPNYLLSLSGNMWTKRELASPVSEFQARGIAEFKGNLYVLDSQGKIFRYANGMRASASPVSWIHPSSSPNTVPGAGSFSIDSNIWITQGNTILRFYKGTFREALQPTLFPELREIAAIETEESLPNLYILDKEHNRFIILTKFGELVAQYQSPAFSSLLDSAVSSDGTKAYLLNGAQIYEISLE